MQSRDWLCIIGLLYRVNQLFVPPLNNNKKDKKVSMSNRNGRCDCSSGGRCRCICDTGFGGLDCSLVNYTCPLSCSNHGLCTPNGRCKCSAGFEGAGCSALIAHCPSQCSGHGLCNTTSLQCICESGFTGASCGEVDLLYIKDQCLGCSGNGFCNPQTGSCEVWQSSLIETQVTLHTFSFSI